MLPASQKLLTLLFTDIEGFTASTALQGDRAAASLLRHLTRPCCRRSGATGAGS